MNPEVEKDKIIFNEHLIDWDRDIFLVEGAFDSIFLNNSIPMLGKSISQHLFQTLLLVDLTLLGMTLQAQEMYCCLQLL
jgi:hypothetical protein